LVGTSEKGFSDAAKAAFERARKTLHGIRNMEIIQRDVKVKEDQNKLIYRVRVKITFQYEKEAAK
jgi:flavin-binding protein dodecin